VRSDNGNKNQASGNAKPHKSRKDVASRRHKGVMLFMVLATLLIVVIVVNGILSLVLTNYRKTYHHVSRIKAYYAAFAGMNLALEKLRGGFWASDSGSPYTYSLCSQFQRSNCDVNDTDIPWPVDISISAANASGIRTVNLTTNYTFTP
jgi:Tfp pilus assembly protein PilX